jgi:hypothetical protein
MLTTTLFAISWVATISGFAVWFNNQATQQPARQNVSNNRS